MKAYFWHIFIGLTQLLNTLLGGWPDETTSSRLWRLREQGKTIGFYGVEIVDALFAWQTVDHCRKAYDAERKRYQVPPILR